MNPMLQITQHLVRQGYDVSFLASDGYRGQVASTGGVFLPHKGFINYHNETDVHRLFSEFPHVPRGIPQLLWIHEKLRVNSIPSGLELFDPPETLRERDSSRAELPKGYTKLPPTRGVSIVPAMWASVDTGPFEFGLPVDGSEAGRMRNIVIAELFAEGTCKKTFEKLADVLQYLCGTTKPIDSLYGNRGRVICHGLWDAGWACHDLTLQMCILALELSRSDWPDNFQVGGTLPRKQIPEGYIYPPWWDEIIANSKKAGQERERVVFVAQGTVVQDYDDMILPTIWGLAGREDLIVRVVLGAKGAELRLKDNETLPLNTRVVDYFVYDAALEFADVFAVAGGYGALTHGVTNGVPMGLGRRLGGQDQSFH